MKRKEILFDILKNFFNENINKGLNWYIICNEVLLKTSIIGYEMYSCLDILDMLRILRLSEYIEDEQMGIWRCLSGIPEYLKYEDVKQSENKNYKQKSEAKLEVFGHCGRTYIRNTFRKELEHFMLEYLKEYNDTEHRLCDICNAFIDSKTGLKDKQKVYACLNGIVSNLVKSNIVVRSKNGIYLK